MSDKNTTAPEVIRAALMAGWDQDQAELSLFSLNFPVELPAGSSADLTAFANLFIQSSLIQAAENAQTDALQVVQLCESPIEIMLAIAVHHQANARGMGSVEIIRTDFDRKRPLSVWARVQLEPQFVIGSYRVDFRLRYETHTPDFDTLVKTKDGKEIPGTKVVLSEVLIECDGHDFHERTKEQAKRDRAKDRFLQSSGYRVFRFTGSEIWKNPLKCADEALKFLEKDSGAW